MSRRLIAACALAALLACAARAAPQVERQYGGGVEGKILNRGGEIVAGAVIVAEGMNGRVQYVGYTEDGGYRLDLPPGAYHVTVSRVGYYSLRRQRVRVRAGRVATINFTLEAARRRARRARRGA